MKPNNSSKTGAVQSVAIKARDYFRLPDYCRRMSASGPQVLSGPASAGMFVPAIILA